MSTLGRSAGSDDPPAMAGQGVTFRQDPDPGSPSVDLRSPFTRREGLGLGITHSSLEGARFRRIFHGVYIQADALVTPEVLAQAALMAAPAGSFISHHTAAKLWRATVPDDAGTHISCPGTRPQRAGLRAHRSPTWAESTTHRGVLVSTPQQCFRELAAAGLGLIDLVVLGDTLVKGGHVTPRALVDAAATWRGRGSRMARRAAGFVRKGVRSPKETRVRMLLVLAGLPEPIINHELRDVAGIPRRYLDLSYPEFRLGIEYDGRQHAESSEQWESDIFRREEFDTEKWRIVVVTNRGVYREPARTLRRVVRAMRDQRMPVPRRLSEEWRRHFPTEELVRYPA
jgi:hypothetical protein